MCEKVLSLCDKQNQCCPLVGMSFATSWLKIAKQAQETHGAFSHGTCSFGLGGLVAPLKVTQLMPESEPQFSCAEATFGLRAGVWTSLLSQIKT